MLNKLEFRIFIYGMTYETLQVNSKNFGDVPMMSDNKAISLDQPAIMGLAQTYPIIVHVLYRVCKCAMQ